MFTWVLGHIPNIKERSVAAGDPLLDCGSLDVNQDVQQACAAHRLRWLHSLQRGASPRIPSVEGDDRRW